MKKQTAMNQVDDLLRFDLGGPPQWALVRGRKSSSPVLLLVQMGPGLPMIHEAAEIERQLHLEERFRVVYWDQRGTGKSFDSKDRASVALETLAGDVRSMVRALCERLRVSEVDVVGFSFGASLALMACADASLPVRTLTCVGPDVNLLEAERYAYAFALAEAERRLHNAAIKALRSIGEPPHADAKRFSERVRWVSNFGGVHRRKTLWAMARDHLAQLWRSPHYTAWEMIGALRGMVATQERMLPALQGFDLLAKPLRIAAPIAIFQGRHDAAAPPFLAPKLANALGADVVWFEDSAHVPHQEEPQRFRDELYRFVTSPGRRADGREWLSTGASQ